MSNQLHWYPSSICRKDIYAYSDYGFECGPFEYWISRDRRFTNPFELVADYQCRERFKTMSAAKKKAQEIENDLTKHFRSRRRKRKSA